MPRARRHKIPQNTQKQPFWGSQAVCQAIFQCQNPSSWQLSFNDGGPMSEPVTDISDVLTASHFTKEESDLGHTLVR